LGRFAAQPGHCSDRSKSVAGLFGQWHDGAIKLFVIRELMALRNRHPQLFAKGDYRPLDASGRQSERVFAFSRCHEGKTMVVAVARLFAAITPADAILPPPETWAATGVILPGDAPRTMRDALTGRHFDAPDGSLPCERLFATLPVAVLVPHP
jgi:(1->4)-alpha-D-glucan 1-alpha-D-glucosylmutase